MNNFEKNNNSGINDNTVRVYYENVRLLFIRFLNIVIQLAQCELQEHIHNCLMENIESLLLNISSTNLNNVVPNLCDYVFALSKNISNIDITKIKSTAKEIQKLACEIEDIQNEYDLYTSL